MRRIPVSPGAQRHVIRGRTGAHRPLGALAKVTGDDRLWATQPKCPFRRRAFIAGDQSGSTVHAELGRSATGRDPGAAAHDQGDCDADALNAREWVVPVQREHATLNSSVRLRWEYADGSELFLVYSDGSDTSVPGEPTLLNRTLALKLTRLARF